MAACGSAAADSTDNESLTTNAPTTETPNTDTASVSNVDSHRLVVNDVWEVKELLGVLRRRRATARSARNSRQARRELRNADAASKHVAEGLAFWRVVEAYVAPAGADGETINAIFAADIGTLDSSVGSIA